MHGSSGGAMKYAPDVKLPKPGEETAAAGLRLLCRPYPAIGRLAPIPIVLAGKAARRSPPKRWPASSTSWGNCFRDHSKSFVFSPYDCLRIAAISPVLLFAGPGATPEGRRPAGLRDLLASRPPRRPGSRLFPLKTLSVPSPAGKRSKQFSLPRVWRQGVAEGQTTREDRDRRVRPAQGAVPIEKA